MRCGIENNATEPTSTTDAAPPLFEWVQEEPYFRGLRVSWRRVRVGDRELTLAALADAAALLDDAELVEEFQRTDRLPYGLELWPAAVMLADYICAGEPGAGRAACELGCGVGLVSLAAAQRDWRVTTTDADPTALRFAEFNAARNHVGIEEYRLLDWSTPPADLRFARVFAADVLYQLIDHRPLLGSIRALLEPTGLAYVADPCRGVADRFPSLADEAGFAVRVLAACATLDDGKVHQGRVFELTSRA